MKRLHVSDHFDSLFILYISTAKPFSLLVRGYIEVKINFEMSKIYQGNFQSAWHSCFLIPRQSFYKKREIIRENFSSSENAICSILLKYQEIDVQIQTRKLKHPT